MVRCHSNSAVSTIPYEVLCKENAVLQRRQYATTASLRAVMVFLLSGLGSGLGDAPMQRCTSLKRLERVTLSDVSPSPIHAWIMKSTSPAAHQQFSFLTRCSSFFFGESIWHEQVSGKILLVECIVHQSRIEQLITVAGKSTDS